MHSNSKLRELATGDQCSSERNSLGGYKRSPLSCLTFFMRFNRILYLTHNVLSSLYPLYTLLALLNSKCDVLFQEQVFMIRLQGCMGGSSKTGLLPTASSQAQPAIPAQKGFRGWFLQPALH